MHKKWFYKNIFFRSWGMSIILGSLNGWSKNKRIKVLKCTRSDTQNRGYKDGLPHRSIGKLGSRSTPENFPTPLLVSYYSMSRLRFPFGSKLHTGFSTGRFLGYLQSMPVFVDTVFVDKYDPCRFLLTFFWPSENATKKISPEIPNFLMETKIFHV